MAIEILKKAWRLSTKNMSEPWFYVNEIYYGTKGQAKAQAIINNDNAELLTDDEFNFMTVRVLRCKEHDIIFYNGEKNYRYNIGMIDRNLKIKNLPADKMYYVQDRRNYVGNSVLWWGLNSNGYTTNIDKAHKFTKQEVQQFINGRPTDIIWESSHVEQGILRHVDGQKLNRDFMI